MHKIAQSEEIFLKQLETTEDGEFMMLMITSNFKKTTIMKKTTTMTKNTRRISTMEMKNSIPFLINSNIFAQTW